MQIARYDLYHISPCHPPRLEVHQRAFFKSTFHLFMLNLKTKNDGAPAYYSEVTAISNILYFAHGSQFLG